MPAPPPGHADAGTRVPLHGSGPWMLLFKSVFEIGPFMPDFLLSCLNHCAGRGVAGRDSRDSARPGRCLLPPCHAYHLPS